MNATETETLTRHDLITLSMLTWNRVAEVERWIDGTDYTLIYEDPEFAHKVEQDDKRYMVELARLAQKIGRIIEEK